VAEAAEAATNYNETMPMSRKALIDQLEFEGFTSEQAEAGVAKAGL
jgi:hypothetical protein